MRASSFKPGRSYLEKIVYSDDEDRNRNEHQRGLHGKSLESQIGLREG